MSAQEDATVLGIPQSSAARRPSAISQILRKISVDMDASKVDWDLSGDDDPQNQFRIIVAADRQTRSRAYALAHRVYQESGLAAAARGMIVAPYDARPHTLTLLAVDEQGHDAATISVVIDSPGGLPADEIYGQELTALRTDGRLAAEVTRLAISKEHKGSRLLLVRLFNFIYVYARRVSGLDDFVIEVHPRHVSYYQRLLLFRPIGPEKPCPRVKNSPSVLLRLKFAESDSVIRRYGGKRSAAASDGERSLYPFFYSWLEEGAVAEFLSRQHQPMHDADIHYFGLHTLASEPAPIAAAGE